VIPNHDLFDAIVINGRDFALDLRVALARCHENVDRRTHRALHFPTRSAGQRGRWQRYREAKRAQA